MFLRSVDMNSAPNAAAREAAVIATACMADVIDNPTERVTFLLGVRDDVSAMAGLAALEAIRLEAARMMPRIPASWGTASDV